MFEKKQYDISILIPGRNEMFMARTVKDLLKNIRGNTEIILGCDGSWPPNDDMVGIEDDPRVTLVYYPEAIGQRKMTNQLCKLSRAKWIIKTDAHCTFDEGFDIKMLQAAEGHEDWTLVPTMRNLHAFDWVCLQGHRRYQGPSGPCEKCGQPTKRDIVWKGKESPKSNGYRFDTTLHFQYHRKLDRKPQFDLGNNLNETMSLQGSFFMLTREKYWELNICDEKHGSWGQQGVEVALKTWLSGGKCVVNRNTWYAHMFRTQGGDFGFPYHLGGKEVDKARNYSRDIWLNNKFEKQILPLSWLLEKFSPLKSSDDGERKFIDWHDPEGMEPLKQVIEAGNKFHAEKKNKKEIIFYTDNQLNLKIAKMCQNQVKRIGLPIVSASLKPMDFGKNIHIKLERGVKAYFSQIIAALEASTADIVYFCEHDVLYHPSHFDFVPPEPDKFYYNHNVWRWKYPEDFCVSWDANQVAELVCYREHVLNWYKEKFKQIEAEDFDRSYEPGGRDKTKFEVFWSTEPNIDIRHGENLTKSKWSKDDFRDKSTCVNWREGKLPDWVKGSIIK